jgi:hypothetical protein
MGTLVCGSPHTAAEKLCGRVPPWRFVARACALWMAAVLVWWGAAAAWEPRYCYTFRTLWCREVRKYGFTD